MNCPECAFDNPDGVKFCVECGSKLEAKCPKCGFGNSPTFKFCGECGYNIKSIKKSPNTISAADNASPPPTLEESTKKIAPSVGERKHVTVLFSDLIN